MELCIENNVKITENKEIENALANDILELNGISRNLTFYFTLVMFSFDCNELIMNQFTERFLLKQLD